MTGAGEARRALLFGGTGAVGREVLAQLTEAGVRVAFTYHRSVQLAAELARRHAQRALEVDLAQPARVRELVTALEAEGEGPDVFVHCAAALRAPSLAEASDEDIEHEHAVNVRAALVACRELGPRMAARGGGDIVLVGALDRGQSLPVPPSFAACQGALGALCMALAKELGGRGVRANMVALGLLDAGLSARLDPRLTRDFVAFSALRRLGTPREAARAIAYLALENTAMNGRVLAAQGGL